MKAKSDFISLCENFLNQLNFYLMKNVFSASLVMLAIILFAFHPVAEKLTSKKTHIKFFSTTPAEDIEAHNYKSVSVLDKSSGSVVFSVPMQAFEFDKALMQKHFNSSRFLNTKKHPKAKLKGKILNLDQINFAKDGTYNAKVSGDLTIMGTTKPLTADGTITIKSGTVTVNSQFDVTLADFGITFSKGKPSTNIAKTVEVTVVAEY